MADDEELEALRQRRLRQLQGQAVQQQAAQAEQQARQANAEAQRQQILRAALTPEARERLSRVKIARPDQGTALEDQVIALAQSGRLQRPIGDEDLKQILARLFPPKRDIRIQRK
jgi:programmed cell death protein 5